MTKLRCFIALVLLVATAITGFIFFAPSQKLTGALDDVKDVDLVNIIAFAKRSNDAYHEENIFRHEYGPLVEAGEFPVSGLRVYIDPNAAGKAQWVILRGTANMPNVFDDLHYVGRDEHELGINVHAGFDQSLQECLPWILARIDPKRPVWVTGHSLGGAVAALLIATLDHRGFKDVSGITFGQPKFTDAHGAAKLANLKILRVVHEEDPIPLLPPHILEGREISTYRHFGHEVLVSASGKFSYMGGHLPGRIDISALWADLEHVRPVFHDMTKGYLPALEIALAAAAKTKPVAAAAAH